MTPGERSALRSALALVVVAAAVRAGADRLSAGADPLAGRPDQAAALKAASDSVRDEIERRSRPLAAGERVDPNRASAAQLDRLPGVGPALAAAWIRHRETGAVFRGVTDLEAVPGIGRATALRLAPLLQFSTRESMLERREETPKVDLNAADSAALIALPGIGPALAGRILARRRARRFAAVDDLVEVKGIGPSTLDRLRDRVVVDRRRR